MPSSNCGWAMASSPFVVAPRMMYSVFLPVAAVVDVCAPADPDASVAAAMAVAMHATTTYLSFLKVSPPVVSRVRPRRVMHVLSRGDTPRGRHPSAFSSRGLAVQGGLFARERRLLAEVGGDERL